MIQTAPMPAAIGVADIDREQPERRQHDRHPFQRVHLDAEGALEIGMARHRRHARFSSADAQGQGLLEQFQPGRLRPALPVPHHPRPPRAIAAHPLRQTAQDPAQRPQPDEVGRLLDAATPGRRPRCSAGRLRLRPAPGRIAAPARHRHRQPAWSCTSARARAARIAWCRPVAAPARSCAPTGVPPPAPWLFPGRAKRRPDRRRGAAAVPARPGAAPA